MLATGHPRGIVKIWNLGTGRESVTLAPPQESNDVCCVRFSPNSRAVAQFVASATQDGTVRLWHAQTGTLYATLVGHQNAPSCIAFSPDGTLLATASADRTVKLWKTMSGSAKGTLQGHSGEVRVVAFSPDNKTIASGSDDGTLKLWDVATCQELISLDAQRGGVRSLAFSPNGKILASGGSARDGLGEIFLWPAASADD
jgi:WD40 repeat protein